MYQISRERRMVTAILPRELAAATDYVAAELLRAASIHRPPVDALSLAAALGISIATNEGQHERARCVRLRTSSGLAPPIPSILLRPELRAERRQWAVAH